MLSVPATKAEVTIGSLIKAVGYSSLKAVDPRYRPESESQLHHQMCGLGQMFETFWVSVSSSGTITLMFPGLWPLYGNIQEKS